MFLTYKFDFQERYDSSFMFMIFFLSGPKVHWRTYRYFFSRREFIKFEMASRLKNIGFSGKGFEKCNWKHRKR